MLRVVATIFIRHRILIVRTDAVLIASSSMNTDEAQFIGKLRNFLALIEKTFPNAPGVRQYVEKYRPFLDNALYHSLVVSFARQELERTKTLQGRMDYIAEWQNKAGVELTPEQLEHVLLYLECFASLLF